jgi:multidrug efflux pump subunit AcrB
MALIVAAVLVVDDAIVVLENIARHRELGADRWQAAVRGASEVGTTLLSMNLALAVVFVSILFLDDFVERLFREFSLTLVAAMAVSVLVALSLVPMLCARLFVDDAQQPSLAARQQCAVRARAWHLSAHPAGQPASPALALAGLRGSDRTQRLAVPAGTQGHRSAAGHRTAARLRAWR